MSSCLRPYVPTNLQPSASFPIKNWYDSHSALRAKYLAHLFPSSFNHPNNSYMIQNYNVSHTVKHLVRIDKDNDMNHPQQEVA
jgi:hypothetical protein